MTDTQMFVINGVLLEEEVQFTLVELSRACRAEVEQLVLLVDEGVLTPSGDDPQRWRFEGATLQRARTVLRLTRELELSISGAALVLDLLEEIRTLKARLRRLGAN
ncbi:MAG: chaperone modulator CbpM [Panacagrimonas sp.]